MTLLSAFVVLIERRRLPRAIVATVTAVSMLLSGFGISAAYAAPGDGRGHGHKVARDLQSAIDAGQTKKSRWSRDVKGRRMVQAVFVSAESDPSMQGLRGEIKRAGGTIDAAMPGLRMLTATLPANRVARVAARSDVKFVAPNRETRRTASTMEAITGATTTGVRTNSTKTSYSGLDGTGIGIAIVDSGVMKNHEAFNNAAGVARGEERADADHDAGRLDQRLRQQHLAAAGQRALASYEAAIDNSASLVQDGYGHGTHVASVAAGRPVTYTTAPDSPASRRTPTSTT
jgi:serine protease AprX